MNKTIQFKKPTVRNYASSEELEDMLDEAKELLYRRQTIEISYKCELESLKSYKELFPWNTKYIESRKGKIIRTQKRLFNINKILKTHIDGISNIIQ